jgi:outer membrane protein assembly factor BamB
MNTQTDNSTPKPVRWLPGVIIVLLQWLLWYVIPLIFSSDNAVMASVAGAMLGGICIVIWWAFFSRAPIIERLGAIALMVLALYTTSRHLDVSIATANMGMMFSIYCIPLMSLAFVIWVVAARNFSNTTRRVSMVVTILLGAGVWTVLRTDGMTGHLHHEINWRWARTSEQRFLEQSHDETMTVAEAVSGASWPGFRGNDRDGIIHGVKIKTDWKASPPVELWRRSIGPGCSSFAVSGDLLFTQEQRGENEVVSCYNLKTGKPVWIHNDKARFWDSHAGAGPRSTPTLYDGRLYTLGATGILNSLSPRDGSVIWSRNAATDTKAKDSGWGFTSSPLVIKDVVIVATTGILSAYDINTGEPRWVGPDGGKGYSSPHLMTIDGVAQVMLMSDVGITSLGFNDGKVLWKDSWKLAEPILQPAIISGGDILLTGGLQNGLRRISVIHENDEWKVNDLWTSTNAKPYFNDIVIHKDHAYGCDGLSLVCVDIKDGKRVWRGGRYGGQLLLLGDQDLILLLTEKGDLALVEANPVAYKEIARYPAIKGKTWNHPVLAGDILLVRNSEEMAAFRLSLSGD